MTNPSLPPPAQVPQMQAIHPMQLTHMFQFQTQQITPLLNTVQQLLANQANLVQQATTLAPDAIPPFLQVNEKEEEWLEWLQQYEARIIAHKVSDLWIPRTVWPQQLPEGVITTLQDDTMETGPSPPPPPFVLLMELGPPTLQCL
ncbi:uncharacterized protein LOC126249023 [Schistocerca nitens]|uniref:uncharacterized protein LOC126249023 n=1 Tax=Schistocerca nitens TaxID=7011 RepID=UPI002119A0FB|nr:uncharacterized protein LOC126249023 [Schistocerca nitens]